MPQARRVVPAIFAIVLGLTSTSCLWTHRVILRKHGKVTPGGTAPPLLNASRDELNMRIANIYNAINSFQAKADLTPSVGSVYTGQITEIRDVSAFVLFRKPGYIRIIGNTPVIGTRAFDMVSDGSDFKLAIFTKNLFIEGSNSAPPVSKNKLENLRPDAFLASMLIRPAGPDEFPALEDATDEDNALYILHFLKKAPDGSWMIARNVWFDREDLTIVRQKVLDPNGNIISDTRYSKWQTYNGVMFPSKIDINRDQDGYGLVLDVVEMKMNTELTNEQFVVNQPPGYQLQVIGAPK